jgi:hypothetical protein
MVINGHCPEWAHLWIPVGDEGAVCRVNCLYRSHQQVKQHKMNLHKLSAFPDWPSSILPVIREHSRPLSRGLGGEAHTAACRIASANENRLRGFRLHFDTSKRVDR